MQRKFEGLFLDESTRYAKDKAADARKDDMPQDMERECAQYNEFRCLCESWGLDIFHQDGSASIEGLLATSVHSSIDLFEDFGQEIQEVLFRNTYQTLIFPKSILRGIKSAYRKKNILKTLVTLSNAVFSIFGISTITVPQSPLKMRCLSLEGMNGPLVEHPFRDEIDNAPGMKKKNIAWRFDPELLADRLVLFSHRLRRARPMRLHSITPEEIDQWLLEYFPVSWLCSLHCSSEKGLPVQVCPIAAGKWAKGPGVIFSPKSSLH
jgi:hypothetical protein